MSARLGPALDLYRRGDLAGARAAAERALADAPGDAALSAFAGLAAAQAGDAAAAIPHFRHALAAAPGDIATRCNLVTALLDAGAVEEAAELCAAAGEDPRLLRLGAFIDQQQGRPGAAAAAYEKVVAAQPGDWESWNNLGNARRAAGDAAGAVAAYRRARALRPDQIEICVNLAHALAEAGEAEERVRVLRAAARARPDDARVQTELGVALAEARDFAAAEAAYRAALATDPGFVPACVELGLLLETQNRLDDLAVLIETAPPAPEIDFLRGWLLRRRGRFAEALAFAEAAPATIAAPRRAQLLGEIKDRLGDAPGAFAAFAEMNRAALATAPSPGGTTYREEVAAAAALLTPERVAAWTPIEVAGQPAAPDFILGFPRSGTTLLDTLLLNLPELHVLEEVPVLDAVERALGPPERLGGLGPEEAAALRRLYFETLDAIAPPAPGPRVVDKFPLHMARAPLLHRLFPDARIVFVERHPCDVVLSCFMANFELNKAMRSFTDIVEAARLYAAVMEAWTRARELLPLNVHHVRYERLIADAEGEMRRLLAFLDLAWDQRVLDNRAAASARAYIRTASYAQVAEPIYRRAAGRWQRYRAELEPVLPILAPWAERLGYPL